VPYEVLPPLKISGIAWELRCLNENSVAHHQPELSPSRALVLGVIAFSRLSFSVFLGLVVIRQLHDDLRSGNDTHIHFLLALGRLKHVYRIYPTLAAANYCDSIELVKPSNDGVVVDFGASPL
jgi:hypothetical protein